VTTKEKILYVALDLFSKNGYEAVSMRDLAAEVGIRQSSIYKHYVNKQAILDAIIAKVVEEIEMMFCSMKVPTADHKNDLIKYSQMEVNEVVLLCTRMLISQRSNEWISKFRQIATIEQYRSPMLSKLFKELFIDRQLGYIEKVFELLMEQNIFMRGNVEQMALLFFAPFFMLQYKYADNEVLLEQKIRTHVSDFINDHLKEE